MADPNSLSDFLEWANRVWGFIAGVIATMVGLGTWLNGKIKAMNTKIDDKADILHGRITATDKLVTQLEGSHEATMLLYTTVSEGIKALNAKTDEQTKILHEVVGELNVMQGKRRQG